MRDPHVRRLMVGETFNPPGHWSSFPPHKHDGRDGEPTLEEVYYFRVNPPQGFGHQMLYTADGESVTHTVRDGDVVLLPYGYHPVSSPPGYRSLLPLGDGRRGAQARALRGPGAPLDSRRPLKADHGRSPISAWTPASCATPPRRHGRTRTVAPGTTAMRAAALRAHHSRRRRRALTVEPGEFETGLICLKGAATIAAGGRTFAMHAVRRALRPARHAFERHGRRARVRLRGACRARSTHAYPLQFVRFADVQKDPGLHFRAGGAASRARR